MWLLAGNAPQAVDFAGVVLLLMVNVLMDGVAVVASMVEGLLGGGGGRNLGMAQCGIVVISVRRDFVVGVAVAPDFVDKLLWLAPMMRLMLRCHGWLFLCLRGTTRVPRDTISS